MMDPAMDPKRRRQDVINTVDFPTNSVEDMIPKTPKLQNPKSGFQSYAKKDLGKKKYFSQPWGS
jgi:hypothetical protein